MLRQAGTRLRWFASVLAFTAGFGVMAGAQTAGSVRGTVKASSGEGLSGAYVKLRNPERRLTFMVISKDQGHYSAMNLPPGKYTVQGIGNGYESEAKPVDVSAGKTATADLSLSSPQVAELPNGWPGRPGKVGGVEIWMHERQTPLADGEGKQIIMEKCTQCHETERIVLLRFDREKWASTVDRMREHIADQGKKPVTDEEARIIVDYLVKNYSGGPGTHNQRPDPNSRIPRTLVKPDAHYVAVDFTLPDHPERDPHDAQADSHGMLWSPQRNGCCLSRFDPKTFTFTEITPPDGRVKTRFSSAIAIHNDVIWMQDGSHNRRWLSYDIKSGKFTPYPVPASITGPVNSNTIIVDSKGWVWGAGDENVLGLNPATGKFVAYPIPYFTKTKKSAQGYGMAISRDGKIWFAERDPSLIGRLDPATGKIDEFKPPIPNSIPRRMGSDSEGNIWVALHEAGYLMKIDYQTTEMSLYKPPTDKSAPYSVVGEPKTGIIWMSEQASDKIARFDPKTEKWTEYSVLNAESDMRRISLDPSNPNRIWWGGDTSNRIGYIDIIR